MYFVIGIDGGGTKSKAVLTDLHLNTFAECTGGPTNFLLRGTGEVSLTLIDLIRECISKSGINENDLVYVVLGTTGAGRINEAEKMKNDFLSMCERENLPVKSFEVESDARVALEGAFKGEPGSILIAGTGSIMFGKDSEGEIHRVGGFGRFIGDEGSGYSIGRKGLNAVAKFYDGRGPGTSLAGLLSEKGITNSESLITEIYVNNFEIPSVAPLVIKSAENGDEICLKILDEESEELISHIKAMKKLIDVKPLGVSLIGSLIAKDNFYSRMFLEKIKNQLENVSVKEPAMPPEMGAALMAAQYFVSRIA